MASNGGGNLGIGNHAKLVKRSHLLILGMTPGLSVVGVGFNPPRIYYHPGLGFLLFGRNPKANILPNSHLSMYVVCSVSIPNVPKSPSVKVLHHV